MKEALCAIQMELTNSCQLACAECPRRFMGRQVGNMDFELAKLIVEEGLEYRKDMGFNLNGLGEPLLYPDLEKFIYYMALKQVVHFDLFTNLLVSSTVVESIAKAIKDSNIDVTLVMTLHLYNERGNKYNTDKLFEKNLKIILNTLGHSGKVKSHISMIDTKYHIDNDFVFDKFINMGLPKENIHKIERLNPWFGLVESMAGKSGYDVGCNTPSICDYPFILFHVGWDGKVIICCTDDVNEECVLGEVKSKGDLRRIWYGEKLEQIRKDFNEYKINIAPCDRCNRTLFARRSDLLLIK